VTTDWLLGQGRHPVSVLKAMPFDENMPEDVQHVLDTAAVLEITEFQVFHMAYAKWYGEVPGDSVIEPFFTGYMFREIVPPWVRQFTRFVLDLYEAGKLDPRKLGIEKIKLTQEMWSRGKRYILILVMVMTSLIVLGEFASDIVKQLGVCYFPPCY
jgi:hypothetical protein